MPEEITPQAIAEYDQALKQAEELLAAMVVSYVQNAARDADNGYPEAISVVALSIFLSTEMPQEEVASALSVAILAFARSGEYG